jgi:hypothetical protein
MTIIRSEKLLPGERDKVIDDESTGSIEWYTSCPDSTSDWLTYQRSQSREKSKKPKGLRRGRAGSSVRQRNVPNT